MSGTSSWECGVGCSRKGHGIRRLGGLPQPNGLFVVTTEKRKSEAAVVGVLRYLGTRAHLVPGVALKDKEHGGMGGGIW